MLATVDAFEIMEWQEYWRLEPFGDEWEQTATICEAIFHANGLVEDVDRNRWRPVPREKPDPTPAQLAAKMNKFKAFAASMKAAKSATPPPES